MVGIFILYLVGKAFYDLAAKYNKSEWGFAIAGVASYYLIQIVVGFCLGGIWALKYGAENIEEALDDNYWGITILTVVIGALTCWAFYEILKMRWSAPHKHKVPANSDLLDDDFLIG